MTALLYTVTLFLSATLLFVVQPLVGKQLLPVLGGTPAVWNACLLFFQAALLGGYFYVHGLRQISPWGQFLFHGTVLMLAVVSLLLREPLQANLADIPTDSDYPTLRLLGVLAMMVGLPFVALSATAPLLQSWFALRGSTDPYFLYAASNVGSMLGLLGYPFLVEQRLDLDDQRHLWAISFGIVAGLMIISGWLIRHQRSIAPLQEVHSPRPTAGSWWRWVALAALPSSWLLSVTTHLTTDIAPVPLLWVVPLAIYLLTFVLVFSWWPDGMRQLMGRVVPMMLMFLIVAWASHATEPLPLIAGIHLATLTLVALLCHGELAATRPPAEHLTRFYLALSLGGALGGLFNGLLAPLLFSRLGLLEYPLAIVLVALVRPEPFRWSLRRRDWLYLVGMTVLTALLNLFVPQLIEQPSSPDAPDALTIRLFRTGLMLGLPVFVLFSLAWNPLRFAIGILLLLTITQLNPVDRGETLLTARNFFGTLRVVRSEDGQYIQLVHGTTRHGQQRINEAASPKPLMYYYPTGPIGRAFEKLPAERQRRVAVVGLGCGAMAAYARPGQQWTFFEIDPGVVRIAQNEQYFTFLKTCQAETRIVLGDARRKLHDEPDGRFDLLVLDAFSSDSIPVHLLTREALALYTRKLAPDGVMIFHLSNRYLDLPPLLARLGATQEPPFSLRLDEDTATEKESADGKYTSIWAVLFRDENHLGELKKDIRWMRRTAEPGPIWTDRFSNLLSVWKRDEP